MRRADRLFEIVQLAQWLEVSERTIYRDIADLTASGVPIDGEAGVGYRLHPHRRVRPFAVFFWGGTWTLGAWCELRRDFRNFCLDRLATLQVGEQEFPDEPGRCFDDYMKRMTES